MTQTDMMEKDTVLVLDDLDNVIGSASKKDSHVFEPDQSRGILHRAFSVFLFDESTGELLLQKRASTKITFPNVRVIPNQMDVCRNERFQTVTTTAGEARNDSDDNTMIHATVLLTLCCHFITS